MTQAPVRVLIASRNPAWSAGMAAFLAVPPLEPATAASADEALARLEAAPHGLLVVARALADGPGADLAREIAGRVPPVTVVVALEEDTPEARAAALACGAAAVIPPHAAPDEVLAVAHDALRGVAADPGALAPLADLMRRTAPREVLLTEQERVVLRLMRRHLTYKEIAMRLGVSWHTVRTHAQSILRKSGVHSRRELEDWDRRLDPRAPDRDLTGTVR